MRSIAVINQKGGVGKTTTAVNLAAALVRREQRVMLVDMDPQGHAGLHLGVDPNTLPEDEEFLTVYDVLVNQTPIASVARYADDKLAIVPSDINLVGAEVELAEHEAREHRLRNAVEPHRENFDTMIIDCAPSLGLLTVNALAAVSEVIIPLSPHFLALQGLGKLLETVTLVRENINPELRISGIVLCMYDRSTRLAQEISQDIAGFLEAADPSQPWYNAKLFDARIRRNIKLAEAPSFGQSIFEYDPSSHGAEDYGQLASEVCGETVTKGPVTAEIETAPDVPPPPSEHLPNGPVTAEDTTSEPTNESAGEPANNAHDAGH